MDIKDIKKTVAEISLRGSYEIFGLRADSRLIEPGEGLPISHEWWQDDPEDKPRIIGQDEWGDDIIKYDASRTTDDPSYNAELECWDMGELEGTCAIELDLDDVEGSVKEVKLYLNHPYRYVYLIAGESYMRGIDTDEIIISNAVCIDRITL